MTQLALNRASGVFFMAVSSFLQYVMFVLENPKVEGSYGFKLEFYKFVISWIKTRWRELMLIKLTKVFETKIR